MTLPRVELQKREMDTKAMWRKVAPKPEDCSRLIDESCELWMEGRPVGIYLVLPESEVSPIRQAVQNIKYASGYRTVGLKSTSRVIGFQPRVAIRHDYCTAAALAHEDPQAHNALCSGAAIASRYFEQYLPEAFNEQEEFVRGKVRPEWILPNGGFYTSGICNWNNLLRYHFDAGNIPGTWNAMLTFKKDIQGGHLAIPELDVALAVRDGTLAIFNAQGLIHGVTPFRKLSPKAYRSTIVFYALQGMCHCGTPVQELERIRQVKTLREQKRRGPQKEGG